MNNDETMQILNSLAVGVSVALKHILNSDLKFGLFIYDDDYPGEAAFISDGEVVDVLHAMRGIMKGVHDNPDDIKFMFDNKSY